MEKWHLWLHKYILICYMKQASDHTHTYVYIIIFICKLWHLKDDELIHVIAQHLSTTTFWYFHCWIHSKTVIGVFIRDEQYHRFVFNWNAARDHGRLPLWRRGVMVSECHNACHDLGMVSGNVSLVAQNRVGAGSDTFTGIVAVWILHIVQFNVPKINLKIF